MDDTSRVTARDIAAMPETRAFADWLNARQQAQEAVVEAAREVVRKLTDLAALGKTDYMMAIDKLAALSVQLERLDALNPPPELDSTRPLPSDEAMRRGVQDAAHGFGE